MMEEDEEEGASMFEHLHHGRGGRIYDTRYRTTYDNIEQLLQQQQQDVRRDERRLGSIIS